VYSTVFHAKEDPVADSKITVRNNGPLKIEGDNITLLDQDGKPFGLAGRTIISLCRCGQSANKPFCDGSHARVGFASECPAVELPPPKPKV
jgi:CDGSH-type Zn-finger protein